MLFFNNEKEELYVKDFWRSPERIANWLDKRKRGVESLQDN